MFEDIRPARRSEIMKRLLSLFVSAVAHAVVILVIVALPLFFLNALPAGELLTFLIAPPPPPPAPPPPGPAVERSAAAPVVSRASIAISPPGIPRGIPPPTDEPPIPAIAAAASAGIQFGVPGSTLPWASGGPIREFTAAAPPPLPPPPPRIRRSPIRGGNLQESKLIRKVAPEYPDIARRARISGDVFLEATVDEEGNVVHLDVIQGHPMLVEAALRAVAQWKYSPTLLNGEPVPIIARVTVSFKLK